MVSESGCPFCAGAARDPHPSPSNELAIAFEDAFPVSQGHTLITPVRHCERVSDLSADEWQALWQLVPLVCERLTTSWAPAGFTIGLNDGAAAGQTVPHVHLHVIPRYPGDVPDPRGGIRWVLPGRAAYWEDDDLN